MFFNHAVESYQEYQQTLAALNEHPDGDWHKLSQAVRDDVVREIEEKLAWSIWSDAATSALKKEKPVRKRQPRKRKVVEEEPKAEADVSL